MAGCFGSSPIDRYMENQLNRYLDSQDEPGDFDFDFNHKVKGKGTVKVSCEAICVSDRDEDGVSISYKAKIKEITWTINGCEADLNKDEMKDVKTLDQQLSDMHDQLKWGSGDKDKKGLFDKVVGEAIFEETKIRGKKLDQKERQAVIDRMVLSGEVIRGKWYLPDKNRKMFEIYGTEDVSTFAPEIPNAERAKIEAALKRANRPVTDDEVMRLFKRKNNL